MIELYQAEWCPFSHRVRQRLTELGVDFIARQVEADKDARDRLEQVTGARGIPALVLDDGRTVLGTDEILEHLDGAYAETDQADRHRQKAADHSRRG